MIINLQAHKVANAHTKLIILSLMVFIYGVSENCLAGAFIFAGQNQRSADIVTHPTGYTGAGGEITVGICIDPSSPANAGGPENALLDVAVQNIVTTYNSLRVTSDNLKTDPAMPIDFIDFESVALHEVGHCIGVAHPNIGALSGLTNAQKNYTQSTSGADNTFELNNPGYDLVIGSGDDIRGDDVNLHWFRKSDNNPFFLASIVDSTTYSRNLADLPAGRGFTFAANGDRNVAYLLGIPNTEAVMQQGVFRNETQRTLIADDIATLKYAMSGVDEMAGTADDYTVNLIYRGITTSDCDVVIKFDNTQTSLAVCQAQGLEISPNHMRISAANIYFNDEANWYFNDTPIVVDSIPAAFTFIDLSNVTRDSIITSNTIIVFGINTSTPISITGGEYSINGGAFTALPGTVKNNDSVNVRHTSSSNISTITATTLNINGVSDTFSSTTQAFSVTPDLFSFIDQANVTPNTIITSNDITVTGIITNATIIVSGGEYSINGGSFTVSTGSVTNGASVRVRHLSSGNYSTTTNTTLNIGESSDVFSSTTLAGTRSRGGGGNGFAILLILFGVLFFRTTYNFVSIFLYPAPHSKFVFNKFILK